MLTEAFNVQGDRFSLSQQVVNLEGTLSQLRTMMSPQNFTDYLKKSLVVLVFGSNDYLNNYLMPNLYSSSFRYKPPEFANLLINQYARQLLVCQHQNLHIQYHFNEPSDNHFETIV